MRLIDADALKEKAVKMYGFGDGKYVSVANIDRQPTIDAVPVVRCKDCKHNNESRALIDGGVWCDYWGTDPDPEDFCSRGERRTSNE